MLLRRSTASIMFLLTFCVDTTTAFTFDGYTVGDSNLNKLDPDCYPFSMSMVASNTARSTSVKYGYNTFLTNEEPPQSCKFRKELPNIKTVLFEYQGNILEKISIFFEAKQIPAKTVRTWLASKVDKSLVANIKKLPKDSLWPDGNQTFEQYKVDDLSINLHIDVENDIEYARSVGITSYKLRKQSLVWAKDPKNNHCLGDFCLNLEKINLLSIAKENGFNQLTKYHFTNPSYGIFNIHSKNVIVEKAENDLLKTIQLHEPHFNCNNPSSCMGNKWQFTGGHENIFSHFIIKNNKPVGYIPEGELMEYAYYYKPSKKGNYYPTLVCKISIKKASGKVLSIDFYNPMAQPDFMEN